MKNIVILGTPRAGKSTFARMLMQRYSNYSLLHMDHFRDTFKVIFPELEINATGGEGMKEDFPNFMSLFFSKCLRNNRNELYYILDGCDIEVDKARKLFNSETTDIYYFGQTLLTKKQIFDNIRKYDTEHDWTRNIDDEELLGYIEGHLIRDKRSKELCSNFGINFIETSINREEVFEDIMAKIDIEEKTTIQKI